MQICRGKTRILPFHEPVVIADENIVIANAVKQSRTSESMDRHGLWPRDDDAGSRSVCGIGPDSGDSQGCPPLRLDVIQCERSNTLGFNIFHALSNVRPQRARDGGLNRAICSLGQRPGTAPPPSSSSRHPGRRAGFMKVGCRPKRKLNRPVRLPRAWEGSA